MIEIFGPWIAISFVYGLGILLIYVLYLMFRNNQVYSLRKGFLNSIVKSIGNTNDFVLLMKIYERYSYKQMLYSLRPIKSFAKELFGEMNKIKEGETK